MSQSNDRHSAVKPCLAAAAQLPCRPAAQGHWDASSHPHGKRGISRPRRTSNSARRRDVFTVCPRYTNARGLLVWTWRVSVQLLPGSNLRVAERRKHDKEIYGTRQPRLPALRITDRGPGLRPPPRGAGFVPGRTDHISHPLPQPCKAVPGSQTSSPRPSGGAQSARTYKHGTLFITTREVLSDSINHMHMVSAGPCTSTCQTVSGLWPLPCVFFFWSF